MVPGSGTLMTTQAEDLIKKGHDVHTIISENQKDFPRLEGNGYTVIPYTAQNTPEKIEGQLPFNFPMFTTHTRSTESFWNLSMEQIRQIENKYRQAISGTIEKFNPDVIHGQHLWLHSGICSEFEKPLVVTVHGTDLMGIQEAKRRAIEARTTLKDTNISDEEKEKATLELQRAMHYYEQAKKGAKAAQKILVISKDQQDKLHEIFPELDTKVELLENGYNPQVFYPVERVDKEKVLGGLRASNTEDGVVPTDYDNMALFVGKFAKFKGIDFILDAEKQYEQTAKQNGKKAITIIVGSGDQEEELQAQAKRLGLENVYFVGRQNHEVIRNLQALADVALVPSRDEPFGLVVIEATACGNPVIGTNAGGIPDIMNTTGKTIKKDYDFKSDSQNPTIVPPDYGTAGTYTTDLGILIPYTFTGEVDENGKPIEDRKIIVDSLADAVTSVFDRTRTFDSKKIAEYTRSHYDQSVINDRLVDTFETAISIHQAPPPPPPKKQETVLKKKVGPSLDDD